MKTWSLILKPPLSIIIKFQNPIFLFKAGAFQRLLPRKFRGKRYLFCHQALTKAPLMTNSLATIKISLNL